MRTTGMLGRSILIAVAAAGCTSEPAGRDASSSPLTDGPAAAAAAAAAPTGDPCRFMTAAQMTAITTDAVSELIRQDDSCTYRSNPEDGPRVVIATTGGHDRMRIARGVVGLTDRMGGAVAGQGAAGRDAAATLKARADRPDVGDEAVWGLSGIIYARQGDAYVEVFPPNLHDPRTHAGYPAILPDEKRRLSIAIANRLFENLARQ